MIFCLTKLQQRKNEPFKPFYVEGPFESEQERLENHEVIEYYEIGKNANKKSNWKILDVFVTKIVVTFIHSLLTYVTTYCHKVYCKQLQRVKIAPFYGMLVTYFTSI